MPEQRREYDLSPIVTMWAVQALSRLLATAGVLLGLNVIFRPAWTDGGIYHTALMLPGAPPSWGWLILVCSANIAVGQVTRKMTCTAVGHFAAAVWATFFGLSILKSFLAYPTIPTGGVVTYMTIAIAHLVIGAAYFGSRR
jgi:hypothetical protein